MTRFTANDLIAFIDGSPSPFHAIHEARSQLTEAGFTPYAEHDRWALSPGNAGYMVRGGKTIIAWRLGQRPPSEAGFRIIAAHSDSPVLKLRVNPARAARDTSLLSTEIYGSPLLHTWLDRDLKLCGRIYFKGDDGSPQFKLVDIEDAVMRVNSLAPHLRKVRAIESVTLDKHDDLHLVFGADKEAIEKQLHDTLYGDAGIDPALALGYELCLADTTPSQITGKGGEFISAPRLDNLFSAYCGLTALIQADGPQDHTQIAVIYDAEEIGSDTWTGAGSNILDMLLSRLNASFNGDAEDLAVAKARSLFVSADMAHAEHPSHTDATDPDHVPSLNEGLAIKTSAKGNYAIGQPATAWFDMVCRDAGLSLQRFMYRCDHGGGSSVGPIVSTSAGICGIDVGAPMLAMHSIREMAGAFDVDHVGRAFTAYFQSSVPFRG
ncbi:MAG: M18 family aminopeptidase [Pseudomonadota bacterium]